MSDLETYLTRCYDLLLQHQEVANKAEDEELCACAKLVTHDNNQPSSL